MYLTITGMLVMASLGAATAPASRPSFSRYVPPDEYAMQAGRAIGEESTGPLVTGVRAVPLMLAALPQGRWRVCESRYGDVASIFWMGVDYAFVPTSPQTAPATRRASPAESVSLFVAVYPDRDAAGLVLGRLALSASMGPTSRSSNLGDIGYVWSFEGVKHTRLAFRRDNVVISLSLPMPLDEAMAVGSKLDELLQAGGPYVDKGTRVPAPTVSLPSTFQVPAGREQHVPLVVRDGNPADLLIDVEGEGVHVRRTPDGRPELLIVARKDASSLATRRVEVTVATPTNVVVLKSMDVEVVP